MHEDDERLQAYREDAKRNLPKLSILLKNANDPELSIFMQNVIDDYMLNVCKLGRSY